jgi:hypothetical protein
LSGETEEALKAFFNQLLPEEATRLDDYLDPELLLYAAYAGYHNNFHTFQNWEQRDAFCIRVIGLAQSVLSPETAKIFCEGLYYVVTENRKISACAASLKFKDGLPFYRLDRELLSGLGFDHLIGAWGAPFGGRVLLGFAGARARAVAAELGDLCQTKTSSLQNLCSHTPRTQNRV